MVSLVAVAVLAVMLLPSMMGGGSKQQAAQMTAATAQANDVQATTLLQSAQTAMTTYSASSGNGFAGATVDQLHSLDPEIAVSGPGQAYLAAVSATTDSYTLVADNPLTGNTFTLAVSNGAVSKTCTVAGRGGCQPGGTW
jgi:type II secretory pathway pseudopilin PulG